MKALYARDARGLQEVFLFPYSHPKTADFLSKCGFFYAIWVENPLFFVG